jgi:single-strand DNA-binding protein
MDLCSCMITGRLTRDCELKYTREGAQVLKFCVAVGRYRTGKKETSFFDCVAWGKGAEVLEPLMVKGAQVAVRGEMRQERWNDMDGAARTSWVMVADTFGVQVMAKPKTDMAGAQDTPQEKDTPQAQETPQEKDTPQGSAHYDEIADAIWDNKIPF